jgi:RNA polymerase sigma-70 factor (ECF subfamily)
LPQLEALATRLDGYQPFHAAAADVFRRCGLALDARAAYERAIELSGTPGERAFLERRAAEVAAGAR